MHSLTLTLTLLVQFVNKNDTLTPVFVWGAPFFSKDAEEEDRWSDVIYWSAGPSLPLTISASIQTQGLPTKFYFDKTTILSYFLLACFPVVFISLLKIRLYINMLPSMFQSAVNDINPLNLTNMQCRRRLMLASESQCRDFLLENKSDELKGNKKKKKIW